MRCTHPRKTAYQQARGGSAWVAAVGARLVMPRSYVPKCVAKVHRNLVRKLRGQLYLFLFAGGGCNPGAWIPRSSVGSNTAQRADFGELCGVVRFLFRAHLQLAVLVTTQHHGAPGDAGVHVRTQASRRRRRRGRSCAHPRC